MTGLVIAGHVPGRYVEEEPGRRYRPRAVKPTLRFLCEACHLRWTASERERACSTTCAGTLRRRAKEREARERFRAAMRAMGKGA